MLKEFLTSLKTSYILIGAIIILIASATFIEKWQGTQVAKSIIYHNPVVILLWFLTVINTICVAIKRKWVKNKKWGLITLHSAFITILLGAIITHYFSFEGIAHIREGKKCNTITLQDNSTKTVPFTIKLLDFSLTRYSGSTAASSYESLLEISSPTTTPTKVTIGVNRFYDLMGYRIFQSSYDIDEKGTILSVNYDRLGMYITYIGYFMVLFGFILILLSKNSHFRSLIKELRSINNKRFLSLLILLFSFATVCNGQNNLENQTIPLDHSKKVSRLLTQNPNGRIEPMDSYCAKLLRKISRKSTFESLTATQVIWSFMFNPDYWSDIEIIFQKNNRIEEQFNIKRGKVAYSSFFDKNGKYKLAEAVKDASQIKPSERGKFEKELLQLDERVTILFSLKEGDMIRLFPCPSDSTGRWRTIADDKSIYAADDSLFVTKIIPWYIESLYKSTSTNRWSETEEVLSMISTYQQKKGGDKIPSKRELDIEIAYNRLNPLFWSMLACLIAGVTLIVISIVPFKNRKCLKRAIGIPYSIITTAFLLNTIAIAARWYISEQMPWASSYESMVSIGWAASLTSLFITYRSTLGSGLASVFGGIILFVAMLNWLDPEITPLVPVLQSSWLMIHVATITFAYGLMGISCLIGIVGVIMVGFRANKVKIKEIKIVSELTIYIALYLMTIGIFVGAIWANESWGRYWGWDAKESWALVTMLIYTLVLHLKFVSFLKSDLSHFITSTLSFLSVLMTYLGVNYYLTGLHSYGSSQQPTIINYILIFYILFIIYSIYLSIKKR